MEDNSKFFLICIKYPKHAEDIKVYEYEGENKNDENKYFAKLNDFNFIFDVLLNNDEEEIKQLKNCDQIFYHKKQIVDKYKILKGRMDFKSAWRLAVTRWLRSIEGYGSWCNEKEI